MPITTHLKLVLDPLLLHENNCTGTVTLIYIVNEESFVKCKHFFAWNICWTYLDLVILNFLFSCTHAHGLLMAHSTRSFPPIFIRVNEASLRYRWKKIKSVFPSALWCIYKLSKTPVTTPKLSKIGCFPGITWQLSKKS